MKFLYFVEERGRGNIKIGVTKDPLGRVGFLQNGNPYPLDIVGLAVGDTMAERSLHRRYDHLRMEGEWFAPDAALRGEIDALPSWEDYQTGAELPIISHGNEVLVAMYADGFTLREIATILGITYQAVGQRARQLGLPERRPRKKDVKPVK